MLALFPSQRGEPQGHAWGDVFFSLLPGSRSSGCVSVCVYFFHFFASEFDFHLFLCLLCLLCLLALLECFAFFLSFLLCI